MISHPIDIFFTLLVLSFWFLFPVGMYFAMTNLEKLRGQNV